MATRILVVDDEASVRHLLQVVLATEGYEPVLAANGAEGLQLAHEHLPALIILDWMMPILDGADFYITKPFDAEEMLAVVRRFVRNGAD